MIDELGLERIDLLKIDVQRAEMDVLLGLDDAALAKVRQIVLEVHDKRDGATAGRADALSDLLRRHGFEVSIRQDALLEGTDRYNCYAVRPGYAESLAERIDWRALAPRPAAALGGELSEQALRGFLEARLPAYMLPSRIARVERLPLTAEGKLDRRALLAALAAEAAAQTLEAPANATEAALLEIWKSVLKRPAIGVSDNFFQVGGDSIRLIQMQVMAREARLAFTLRDVFNHQSIRELARLLAAPASPADAAASSAPRVLEPFALLSAAERKRLPEGLDDAYPMTSLQQGMLLQSEASGDPRLLHNVVLHEVHGRLDGELLARAWAILIGRHAILRTGFDLHGGQVPCNGSTRPLRSPPRCRCTTCVASMGKHGACACVPGSRKSRPPRSTGAAHHWCASPRWRWTSGASPWASPNTIACWTAGACKAWGTSCWRSTPTFSPVSSRGKRKRPR